MRTPQCPQLRPGFKAASAFLAETSAAAPLLTGSGWDGLGVLVKAHCSRSIRVRFIRKIIRAMLVSVNSAIVKQANSIPIHDVVVFSSINFLVYNAYGMCTLHLSLHLRTEFMREVLIIAGTETRTTGHVF